jgi:hypothetical protein
MADAVRTLVPQLIERFMVDAPDTILIEPWAIAKYEGEYTYYFIIDKNQCLVFAYADTLQDAIDWAVAQKVTNAKEIASHQIENAYKAIDHLLHTGYKENASDLVARFDEVDFDYYGVTRTLVNMVTYMGEAGMSSRLADDLKDAKNNTCRAKLAQQQQEEQTA